MTKLKLLYVDDEEFNLVLFVRLYKNLFDITTATSADEGIEKLKDEDGITIVISDLTMPEKNGVDFIKEATLLNPELKFYILSGYSTTQEIDDLIEDGVISALLEKPFVAEQIEALAKD